MIVNALATVVYFALLLYFFVMWARFLLELARNFARNWRPAGFGLVLAELAFTVTDPPIRAVRRIVPPLRFGGVAIDFAWSIVMLLVVILMSVAVVFRR